MITDIDLLAPMPDPDLLFSQSIGDMPHLGLEDNSTDLDNSQFISGSIEEPRAEPMLLDDADELRLDDFEDDVPVRGYDEGTSIEMGRDAPPARRDSEEMRSSPKLLEEDDLGLDDDPFGDTTAMQPAGDLDVGFGADMGMEGMTEQGIPVDEATVADAPAAEEPEPERERDAVSPLSSIRSSVERDLEQTFQEHQTIDFQLGDEGEQQDGEEEATARQAQRAKRRRLLHADAETQIPNTQIREQQNDRSKILKPSSFLPKDPMLLTLMNMQKSGGFVSNILGDGRSLGWAPELRGILSLEVVSRPSHKRKRDSGVADLGSEEDEAAADKQPTPQLEFEQSELDAGVTAGFGEDPSLVQGEEVLEQLPADEGVGAPEEEQFQEDEAFSPADNFDDTTVPLLHPAESGPISVGTKHAVHLLRERFGAEAETDESARQKTSVLFQDMLPEATTTKADATKMFFEVLVLATKDAIKVEQPVNELGGPLRIRGKRGLWGSWAETSAGGELASQVAPTASPAVVAES
jgi:cohesin complex subunit SCC1